MSRLTRLLLPFAAALALPGCVAFHSLPYQDYASRPDDGVLRIVFDQQGDPWPLDNDPATVAVLPPDLDKGRSFRLTQRLAKAAVPYDRTAIIEAAARRIAPGGRVVVLIKGFNNSYGTFAREYAATREWLAAEGAPADLRFVEIYWDALHRAGGKVPYPLGLFGRSRGNAERMAQCGLRDLLSRLPAGTDVTFVAHSLGAAAAIDAVVPPPPSWKAVKCTEGKNVMPVPAALGDVRIVAFAPAIGAGQLLDGANRIESARFAGLARLYSAWNPNDPAVTKRQLGLNLPDTIGGDTRLGGNTGFVEKVRRLFAGADMKTRFQPLRFEQKSHALPAYLADRERARCVLWAAMLLPEQPDGCTLSR